MRFSNKKELNAIKIMTIYNLFWMKRVKKYIINNKIL